MTEILNVGVYDSTLFFQNAKKTPERTVAHYELELYISGKGSSVVNGLPYPHQKGRFLFAKPGMKRYSLNCFLCYNLHLKMPAQTASLFSEVPATFMVSDFGVYENQFQEITHLWSTEHDRLFLVQSKLYQLFDLILRDALKNPENKQTISGITPKLIRQATTFIETHYTQNISLKDIADAINFSPIYFHNAFTAYIGKTPHAYLMDQRLKTAKQDLLTTDLSILEIAERCGFSSHSHFDYAFKKSFGITPSAFRKQRYFMK